MRIEHLNRTVSYRNDELTHRRGTDNAGDLDPPHEPETTSTLELPESRRASGLTSQEPNPMKNEQART